MNQTAQNPILDARDDGYGGINTANEVERRSWPMRFVPKSGLRYIMLCSQPDNEPSAHRKARIRRSRASGHGDPSVGFLRYSW
jgi:hypothetical protein